MADIKKADFEKQVIENGKVVTYGIPHGRTSPEIVGMTSLSDVKVIQDQQKQVDATVAQAQTEVEQQKELNAKASREALAADSAQKEKDKAESLKKTKDK